MNKASEMRMLHEKLLSMDCLSIVLTLVCFLQACQGQKYPYDAGQLQKMKTDTSKANQTRYLVADRSLLSIYINRPCNNIQGALQHPLKKALQKEGSEVEYGERMLALHRGGVTEHHRYLDCVLWLGGKGEDLDKKAYVQRFCGTKTLCSVQLSRRDHCKEQLLKTIEVLKAGDIPTNYSYDFAVDNEAYVGKLCGLFYLDSQKNL